MSNHEPPSSRRTKQPTSDVLYFAYGSNLDANQIIARCSSARFEALGVLQNHRLAFGGFSHQWDGAVATVLPKRGECVQGVLFRLGRADLRTLDRYEGHPFAYERAAKMVLDRRGQRRLAQVYLQPVADFEAGAPHERYLAVLRNAYRQLGFDLEDLLRASMPASKPAPVELRELTRVFVYGTLLGGERNHRLLSGARFVGAVSTMPRFELRDLGSFPALVRGGGRAVEGEVYEVRPPTLKALDHLEGHPSFYRRFPVRLSDGSVAETYLLRRSQAEGRPVIEANNWRTRVKEN